MQDWGFEQLSQFEEADCWVLPENWQAIEVFIACNTQWRYLSSMSGAVRTGLDYAAVYSTMNMMQVEDKKDCLIRLQVCEREALRIFNAD